MQCKYFDACCQVVLKRNQLISCKWGLGGFSALVGWVPKIGTSKILVFLCCLAPRGIITGGQPALLHLQKGFSELCFDLLIPYFFCRLLCYCS